jgi:hypothetical protein
MNYKLTYSQTQKLQRLVLAPLENITLEGIEYEVPKDFSGSIGSYYKTKNLEVVKNKSMQEYGKLQNKVNETKLRFDNETDRNRKAILEKEMEDLSQKLLGLNLAFLEDTALIASLQDTPELKSIVELSTAKIGLELLIMTNQYSGESLENDYTMLAQHFLKVWECESNNFPTFLNLAIVQAQKIAKL